MRTTRHLATAIVLCLASAPLLAQKQVHLLATITDPAGADVTTVDPKDVHVSENGVAATVVSVEPVERVPKVQILIDTGIGMPYEALGDLRTAVQGLLMALPPTIETTLVATAPQPHFVERATTDHAKLLAAVDRMGLAGELASNVIVDRR